MAVTGLAFYRSRGDTLPTEAKPSGRRWRAGEAARLAALDVVLAGVSYLL